jgi:hypothetical protein
VAVKAASPDDGIKWPSLEICQSPRATAQSGKNSPESAAEDEAEGSPPDLRVVLELPRLSYAVVFEDEKAFDELVFALGRFAGLVRGAVMNSSCHACHVSHAYLVMVTVRGVPHSLLSHPRPGPVQQRVAQQDLDPNRGRHTAPWVE